MLFSAKTPVLPTSETALKGREAPIPTAQTHFVSGRPLAGPYPEGFECVQFAAGCFWGVERKFWEVPGVWVTAAGYGGGITHNPTYEEVCSGMTGHTEVVQVVWDPEKVGFSDLLKLFWESHDPTQGMRQGNDVGTQYRSAIYASTPGQEAQALASREAYGEALSGRGFGPVTTDIRQAGHFYFAEAYHQQYLAKNPGGYCGIGGTGVACQTGAD